MVSKRVAAMLRKRAIIEGNFGSFEETRGEETFSTTPARSLPTHPRSASLPFQIGGWDPMWDTYKRPSVRRPPKLHLKERTRHDRFQRIQGKLEEQPQKLQDYRKGIQDAKPKPGIATLYKRLLTRRG